LEHEQTSEAGVELRTVARGGAVQVLGSFVRRGLHFVFVAVAVRLLGPAGFGLYRQISQILDMAGQLGPGGFEYATVRFVARARARGEPGLVRGTLWLGLAGAGAVSVVAFGLIFFGADLLASSFAASTGGARNFASLLRVGAAFVPLWALMQILRFHTQAYKTMAPSVLVGQVLQPGAHVLLASAALLAGFGVEGAVLALVAATALSLAAAGLASRRMLTADERAGREWPRVGSLTRFAVPQAGAHFLNIQSLGLGIIILGILRSDLEVGLFAVALSLQGLGGVFLQGLVNIWAPVVTDLYEKGRIETLGSVYQTINRWIATFSFPVFVALILEPGIFVRVLAGPEALDAVALVAVMAAGNLFYVGTGPSSHILSMTGRPWLNFLNSAVAVVLYLALGWWLVPSYGAVGMAAVDAAVTALVNLARVVEGKILVGVHPYGRTFLKPVAATLVFAGILAGGRLLPESLPVDLAVLAVASVVYLAVLAAMRLDPEERDLLERLKRALSRGRRGKTQRTGS
jgi:O-antigen/teichoic acid export membrane protein